MGITDMLIRKVWCFSCNKYTTTATINNGFVEDTAGDKLKECTRCFGKNIALMINELEEE